MVNKSTFALQKAAGEIKAAIAHLELALSSINNAAGDPQEILRPTHLTADANSPTLPQWQAATGCSTFQQPLPVSQQAVLGAIAQLQRVPASQNNLTLVAAIAGHSPSDKVFRDAIYKLEQLDFVSSKKNAAILTEKGKLLPLSSATQLTSEKLVQLVGMQLPKKQRSILNLLYEKNGNALSLDEIAKSLGALHDNASLRRDLHKLQEFSLIEKVTSKSYACSDLLFL